MSHVAFPDGNRVRADAVGRALVDHALRQPPGRVAQALRDGAATLVGLSRDPVNAAARRILRAQAFELASAAGRAPTVSDFRDLLLETEASYGDVGPASDQDLIASRREMHEARNGPESGSSVSIAPHSFDVDATLGRSAIVQWIDPRVGPSAEQVTDGVKQSQTVAFWQGSKKEAQAVTVDVGLVQPPVPSGSVAVVGLVPPPDLSVRPWFQAEYGSDGCRTVVKGDVGFGRRLTLVGNYVSVTVGMDPPYPGLAPGRLSIGASIGTFAAPSQAPVTLTAYIDKLQSASVSPPVQRPAAAVSLADVQTDAPDGEFLQFFFYGLGGPVGTPLTQFIWTVGTPFQPRLLYGDMAYLTVLYAGRPGGEANVRPVFQISL